MIPYLVNMTAHLFIYEKINTTLARAKKLKSYAEKLITIGKTDSVNSRRIATSKIRDKQAVKKLFEVISKRYADRNGGCIQIFKLGFRQGDSAPLAIVRLIQ
ncbi:MAG: 50S ribosomal protein L17 [Elusimicrobia bacterium]|nr:50S ribosomal protein L17 [Elusimicrobiota bacterium]